MDPSRRQLVELARIVAATSPEEIDCDVMLERVAAYLETQDGDAELSNELQTVRQHLDVCPQCREEFDALVRAHRDG